MISLKYFPDRDAPIMRRLNWFGPSSGVWNPVIGRNSLGNDILRYPWKRSISLTMVARYVRYVLRVWSVCWGL